MNMHRVAPLACLLAAAGQAHAQQCSGLFFNAGDPQTNAFNGTAVAIDGPYVLSGASGKKVGNTVNAGEVYCYGLIGGNWGQVTHFVANDPTTNAYFGSSVGLGAAHTWAIVGAPGVSSNAGTAYFFKRDINTNLWNQTSKLLPSLAAGDKFGWAVAMNKLGNIAVVSAPNATIDDLFGATSGAGMALVYARTGDTWNYQMDLHQYAGGIRHVNDSYGSAVAADVNVVLAGVRNGDSATHTDCGYVHFWTRDASNVWGADGEQFAPDAQDGDHFGDAVSISGSYAAIGAPGATTVGLGDAGAVYIFKKTPGGWVYDQKLIATDNYPGLAFGSRVSIDGSYLVIGTGSVKQRAYLYRMTPSGQWIQDARYQNPNPNAAAVDDGFASAVAMDGDHFVSGAWGYDTPSYAQSGALYIYDRPTMGSDSCDGAWWVGTGTYQACTTNCTVDGYSTCGTGVPTGPDIWFTYTAPASGLVSIDTLGSSIDTILSVHSGCPGVQANTIACNDDYATPERWSKLTLNVSQGQTYLVRIAGYDGTRGPVTLNIGAVNACYANCDASTAAPILNVQDFACFLNKFANSDPWANCDGSTVVPVLNVQDFSCFLNKFSAGCS